MMIVRIAVLELGDKAVDHQECFDYHFHVYEEHDCKQVLVGKLYFASVSGRGYGEHFTREDMQKTVWWKQPEQYGFAIEGSPRRWKIVNTFVVQRNGLPVVELVLRQYCGW